MENVYILVMIMMITNFNNTHVKFWRTQDMKIKIKREKCGKREKEEGRGGKCINISNDNDNQF